MRERCLHLDDPALDLGELKALVALSALVLVGDTGPRQIAVALDRPVVVLMGPTDSRHTASQLDRQRVLRAGVDCSPCHLSRCPIDHRCMTRLTPERAVAAAEELLA
jgi:heptosyltransferase-2